LHGKLEDDAIGAQQTLRLDRAIGHQVDPAIGIGRRHVDHFNAVDLGRRACQRRIGHRFFGIGVEHQYQGLAHACLLGFDKPDMSFG